MYHRVLVLIVIVLYPGNVCTEKTETEDKEPTYKNIEQLWANLTTGRNIQIRPVKNPAEPVLVYFYYHLTSILDFNEVEGRLTVRGYFGIHWVDQTVSWDPDEYGVDSLTYNAELFWKPTLSIGNPYGEGVNLYHDDHVKRIKHDGVIDWLPGGLTSVTCAADVTEYPFDTQQCSIDVVVNGYREHEVILIPINLMTDWLLPHRTWGLVDKSMSRIPVPQVVYFNLKLERKPMFFIFNLILPIVLMCILNPFVFLLPADSGERVGYSVTVLLAIAVFLTISSSSLPAISEPIIPTICILLFVDVAFSAVILLFVIVTLRFYFRSEDVPVTKSAQKFVKCCRYIRCGCCRKSSKEEKLYTEEMSDEIFKIPAADYLYRGTSSSDLISSEAKVDMDDSGITWKDVGSELDVIFGVLSGIIMVLIHVLYILVVASVIKLR